MNRYLPLLSLLLFSFASFGQDTAMVFSKYETYADTAGRIYKYEAKTIGTLRNARFSVTKVTNTGTGLATRAIKIEPDFTSSGEYRSYYIDMEEMEGVSKTLAYYRTVMQEIPQTLTTYEYATSNNVMVNCSLVKGSYASAWHIYLFQQHWYRQKAIPGTWYDFRAKDVDELIALFKKAQETVL